jgi:chaperonin GroEL (HSP60 family)
MGSLDCKNRATWYILMVLMWVVWLQLISEDLGLKLEKVQPDMLGSAKRVTVSKDDTIILDGGGDKKGIEERCEQVLIS